MKFLKRDEITASQFCPGGFLTTYLSTGSEGYSIIHTNMKLRDDAKPGKDMADIVDEYCKIARSEGYGYDDWTVEDTGSLKAAKQACRAHRKALSEQEKNDYRIAQRNFWINDHEERIVELNERMGSTNEFDIKYRHHDVKILACIEEELTRQMKERAEDPYDVAV